MYGVDGHIWLRSSTLTLIIIIIVIIMMTIKKMMILCVWSHLVKIPNPHTDHHYHDDHQEDDDFMCMVTSG